MKKICAKISMLLVFLLACVGCKQVYQPPSITAVRNYLVVDGYINAGADSTMVTLTRTRSLTDLSGPVPEQGAQVIVEGDGGYSNALTAMGNGLYAAAGLNLVNSQKYRLNITTSNGENYLSDYNPVKLSPPIDSISWIKSDTGVSVFANTHDPLGTTRYYRWDYVETWEYHSPYDTYLHFDPTDSSVRMSNISSDSVATCWNSDHSTAILIASSAKLSQDLIYRAPLAIIPTNSEKLNVEYSINVRQYALTADAYNYWQTLKTSTEEAGGFFDQQPSQITGNVHCVNNPAEPVIGYVSVGATVQQRIFIKYLQVFPWNFDTGCRLVSTADNKDSIAFFYYGFNALPVATEMVPGTLIKRYDFAYRYCVDCTLGGRTTVKPSFWQ